MSRARRIALNTLWLLLSQIIPFIASIFVVGYVARVIGSSGFGLLSGAMAVAEMASPIVFAGIQLILVREIVKDPDRGRTAVGDALAIRLLLLPLFAAIVYFATPAVVPRDMVLLAIATVFFMMYMQSLTIGFEASERMHFIAIGTILLNAVGMTLSVLAVMYGLGERGVLGARCAGQFSAFLYLCIALPLALYRPKLQIDVKRWIRTLKMGIPLAVPFFFGLVLLQVDKVMMLQMLGPVRGPIATGQYESVTMLAYKFEMVIIAFATAVTPALVSTWNEDKEGYRRLLGGALRVALLLGLPVAIGTGFIATDVMDLIFGAEYVRSAHALALIVWFVPLQFLNRVMAASLGASDREKWVLVIVSIAVMTNVSLNAVFIPMWSYEGAAIATVCSEVVLVVLNFLAQWKDLAGILRHLKLFRLLLACGLLYGLCWLLRSQHALLILGAAVAAYPVLVVGARCISKDEVKRILGRE